MFSFIFPPFFFFCCCFTYSQEGNRRQRQKRQHGLWLLRSSQKTDAADPTGVGRGRVPLWREREWKEEKERGKREWRGAGCQDRGLQNRTTTENPLSQVLYPTTPLVQASARPIPPLLTLPSSRLAPFPSLK